MIVDLARHGGASFIIINREERHDAHLRLDAPAWDLPQALSRASSSGQDLSSEVDPPSFTQASARAAALWHEMFPSEET